MKRKARTEMGTFSASAIDLFASALGAFIIITVVLFPYFPNLSPDPLKAIIDQLRSDKAAIEIALANANDKNQDLTLRNGTLQANVNTLTARVSTLTTKVGDLNNGLNAANGAIGDKDRLIADLTGQLDGTAFIGVEPNSNNFQLVLDMSGSIQAYEGTVKTVVGDILSRLKPSDNLRLVTYRGDVNTPIIQTWPSNRGFQTGITQTNKADALRFVTSALKGSGGGTPTFSAMKPVIRIQDKSTIILLTDGVPQVVDGTTTSRNDIEHAVSQLTQLNAGRHQINIIAIGEFVDKPIASAITPLATRNSGVLVAVP